KPVVLIKYGRLYSTIAIILPVLFVLFSYFFYANLASLNGFIYFSLMILVLFTNYIILRRVTPQAEHIVETSTKNLKTLRGYTTLINKIENESFKSKKLYELQSIFKHSRY